MTTVAIRRVNQAHKNGAQAVIDAVLAVAAIWATVAAVKAIVAALAPIIGMALLGYLLLGRR